MANHKSALKRNRQNKTRNVRNNIRRTQVKTSIKKTLVAINDKGHEVAHQTLRQAEKVISKVAGTKVIHKRSASRKISQLAKRVNQMKSGA